jgi:hypothetical protein
MDGNYVRPSTPVTLSGPWRKEIKGKNPAAASCRATVKCRIPPVSFRFGGDGVLPPGGGPTIRGSSTTTSRAVTTPPPHEQRQRSHGRHHRASNRRPIRTATPRAPHRRSSPPPHPPATAPQPRLRPRTEEGRTSPGLAREHLHPTGSRSPRTGEHLHRAGEHLHSTASDPARAEPQMARAQGLAVAASSEAGGYPATGAPVRETGRAAWEEREHREREKRAMLRQAVAAGSWLAGSSAPPSERSRRRGQGGMAGWERKCGSTFTSAREDARRRGVGMSGARGSRGAR